MSVLSLILSFGVWAAAAFPGVDANSIALAQARMIGDPHSSHGVGLGGAAVRGKAIKVSPTRTVAVTIMGQEKAGVIAPKNVEIRDMQTTEDRYTEEGLSGTRRLSSMRRYDLDADGNTDKVTEQSDSVWVASRALDGEARDTLAQELADKVKVALGAADWGALVSKITREGGLAPGLAGVSYLETRTPENEYVLAMVSPRRFAGENLNGPPNERVVTLKFIQPDRPLQRGVEQGYETSSYTLIVEADGTPVRLIHHVTRAATGMEERSALPHDAAGARRVMDDFLGAQNP